jgi:gluconokinase
MTSAQVIVGLDVGTTGVKAAAFGLDAPARHVAIREYPLLEPEPGRQVQDPAAILTAAAGALAECVAAAGGAEVVAISVSTAMHGLLGLDAQRRPVTPLVTWADGRAREQSAALRRSGQAKELHALTGAPVHPMTPLTKLMWFAENDPATWSAARWWIGLKEHLLLWLTGELVTELSSASGTGLLDIAHGEWSPVALALCGVSADQLPEILPTTATLALAPAAAERIGVPAGTTVVAGAADGPLGNLGTGALAPGVAGLSLGTSGAIRMAVEGPKVDAGRTLFCYALTDSVWVVGGAISNGGGAIRWAGRSLAPDIQAAAGDEGPDAAVLELAASVPAGSDGLVMLPYLVAERAPLWDPDLSGSLLGLRREHTRAHIIRAALEGVCLQMRLILDQVHAVDPVHRVLATGGAFRSRLWREVMTAALDRPLQVVGGAEGTALGAAALGLFALGRAPTLADAAARLAAGEAPTPPVAVDPELVAIYDRVRASIPGLIGELGGLVRLLADEPAAGVGARSPRPSQPT